MQIRQSAELVDEVIKEALKHTGQSRTGRTIKVEEEDELILAKMDARLIVQVLINLIKNAKESCGQNTAPQIEVELEQVPGKVCSLTVRDNGEGILPEVIDKVFVPFFTTKPSGSGIGLSLCKQIMNLHGGTITVSSEIGKGSCFTLMFPGR